MLPADPTVSDRPMIKAVIARETEMFVQRDFDRWAACWVQDARTRELCISSSLGATVLEGWDQLGPYMRHVMAKNATCAKSRIERSNWVITIHGDMAHAVFDNHALQTSGRIEETFETRVLERSDGDWRILFAAFVLRGPRHSELGTLAVNARGEILCPPDQARAQLAQHPGLMISNNRLRAIKPAWDQILQAGLARAAEQHGYFEHYRYMTQSGRSFRLPLVLGETDEGRVAVCILFVRDGITFVETREDGDLEARMSVAQTVFGLSEGQMLLARHIVAGDNLTAASGALGISINTARTHLSRIYEKTGIQSQTALVRTLLSVG